MRFVCSCFGVYHSPRSSGVQVLGCQHLFSLNFLISVGHDGFVAQKNRGFLSGPWRFSAMLDKAPIIDWKNERFCGTRKLSNVWTRGPRSQALARRIGWTRCRGSRTMVASLIGRTCCRRSLRPVAGLIGWMRCWRSVHSPALAGTDSAPQPPMEDVEALRGRLSAGKDKIMPPKGVGRAAG